MYLPIYGPQNLNIQMLISPEPLGQITSNFHSFGRIRVLHVDKVGCQSEFGNPLFLACENGQKFYTFVYIVSWLSLWFSRFGEILLSFFFLFLSPLWPCQATNTYTHLYIYIPQNLKVLKGRGDLYPCCYDLE